MARQAIRNEGKAAEMRFLAVVKDSRLSTEAKRGDVIVPVDGDPSFIEIKECHSNTINQVRAVKFIPLVIYSPQFGDSWIVIPPHDVVSIVAGKSRGQHTEVPFECANLSLSQVSGEFRCGDGELEERVIAAVREGKKFDAVRQVMVNLQCELHAISRKAKDEVAEVISRMARET